MRLTRAIAALGALVACGGDPPAPAALPAGVEAISLLGDTLRSFPMEDSVRASFERNLASAESALAAAPGDADAEIWVGRRLGYLGRYRDAIALFTRGIAAHPDDARFLRHRGHRWISVRQFDSAVADLERAARLVEGRPDEIEPDGLPNARGIPTSSLQSNIWYHLALAYYLRGDWARAETTWRTALERSPSLDNRIACTFWLYLTLRRVGRDAEAEALLEPVTDTLDIIENTAYWHLLLAYKAGSAMGLLPPGGPDSPVPNLATAHGVGAWALVTGDTVTARRVFARAVAGSSWPAFAYVAAEAELARLRAP